MARAISLDGSALVGPTEKPKTDGDRIVITMAQLKDLGAPGMARLGEMLKDPTWNYDPCELYFWRERTSVEKAFQEKIAEDKATKIRSVFGTRMDYVLPKSWVMLADDGE